MTGDSNEPPSRLPARLRGRGGERAEFRHRGLVPSGRDRCRGGHQAVEHRSRRSSSTGPRRSSRSANEHGVSATFYFLGWIAERYPALVRRVAEAGHEIGTHSYWHRKVCDLDEATFREDLVRSIEVIQDAGGVEVTSFRAPSFSITPGTEWAFDVLLDAGLRYDASLFPVARENGGYPCVETPHVFTAAPSGRSMPELPMSLMRARPEAGRLLRRRLPATLPRLAHSSWLPRAESPRDSRGGLPSSRVTSRRIVRWSRCRASRRFKCYVGLSSTAAKLSLDSVAVPIRLLR